MVKVSVVMPAYNSEKYIKDAIDSILNQTYTDYEFIIVNDGSTDGTLDIIKSFEDSRIKVLINSENMGIIYSLNKGLSAAKGEYIARMDADDISLKNRFEKQVIFLDNNPSIGVVGSSITIFGEGIDNYNRIYNSNKDILKAELLFNSCIAHPSVMIRKKCLVENNLSYNPNYGGREDFALWWEIAKISEISTIPDVLLKYRIHLHQITKNVSEESKNNEKMFLNTRLKDIGVTLNDDEQELFLKYCRVEFDKLDYYDVVEYLNILKKIVATNNHTGYFDVKSLKCVCALSMNYIINEIKCSRLKKLWLYISTKRKKIYTLEMFIKSIRVWL